MKLTAVRLHNVRRFVDCGIAIENIGDGVNVLSAVNEYGKSTCFDALHALFFQPHTGTPAAVKSLRPYSGGSPMVEADIVTPDGRFRLSKRYYGGKHAKVADLGSGRLIAQADEAEQFIGGLVRGGAAGPAGLLWVRQGNTGLEKRSTSEERDEKQAREGVLSSVQGEVEALTGGRRMDEMLEACKAELLPLVTATGRPKAGGPYDTAIKDRDVLAAEERRLDEDVRELHEALEARRQKRKRLAELDAPDEIAVLRKKVDEADAALRAARSYRETMKSAEAEAELARNRRDDAVKEMESHRAMLARAAELEIERQRAAELRDQAHTRQRAARDAAETASKAVETAEEEERQARALLARLEKAMRARDAAERKTALRANLDKAEAARKEVETGKASLRTLAVADETLSELEAIETELAGFRAAAAAKAPSVTMHYAPGAEDRVSLDDTPMIDGKDYPVSVNARLHLGSLGTLALAPKLHDTVAGDIAAATDRRRALLEPLGVSTLAEARQRADKARRMESTVELAQRTLALLAPDGLDALRNALARAEAESTDDLELKGDPDAARAAVKNAEERIMQTRNAVRASNPAIAAADGAVVNAEKALAAIEGELNRVDTALGPDAERSGHGAELAGCISNMETALAPLQAKADALRQSAPDLAAAEGALERARSAMEGISGAAGKLRVEIADLNGRIATRSDEAVEEAWRETAEAHSEAIATVTRLEREVAVLERLRTALETARTEARDHYFEPVLSELHPLMGLLFDDAAVVFDDSTLLPQTVQRDGQVEAVDHLSGGMREQLAVLTRLAFARLLAREGHPTPVILDDALVYSDDDRIEKMFDALHRQGRDQQILVFSCRQRAFARLGGTMLDVKDWMPDG